MLKPTSSFKLSKSTKRSLATIVDPVQRGAFKRAMIDAELSAALAPKVRDRNNGSRAPQGTANYVTNDTGTASTQA